MRSFFVFLLIFSTFKASARTYPYENQVLKQTQVMFEWDEVAQCDNYQLYIYNKTQPGKTVVSMRTSSLAILVYEGLEFNQSYTWHYEAYSKGRLVFTGKTMNFETSMDARFSPRYLNIATPVNEKKNTSECIFLDGIGAAINYKGEVIWQLSNPVFENSQKKQFRNMQISPQGSITTLSLSEFYELDRESNILWKTDKAAFFSNDTVEYYHHDAKRLNNGDYLLCSYRFEKEQCAHYPAKKCIVKYGSLVQLSPAHRLTWSWSEKNNVPDADTYRNADTANDKIPGNHLNGFDIHEPSGLILLSFRDNNRVMMINRNTGKVVLDLQPKKRKYLEFYGQHSPLFINEGSFVFYNNNMQIQNYKDSVFNAGVIRIDFRKNDFTYKKAWEYVYATADMPYGSTGKEGYVQLLPNGNYLIGIGGHNQIIEVTPGKHMVWKAVITALEKKENTWNEISSYRNHFYSSLYPRYFTIQTKHLPGKNVLKINNDGTENDEYEIYLKGKKNTLLKTVKIKAGKSGSIVLNLQGNSNPVLVKPKGVEGISREITL